MTLKFSLQIFDKIPKDQISWKSVQRDRSRCMRTAGWSDGHTDTTKLTIAFRNFANAPKNDSKKWSSTPKTRVHTETSTSTDFCTNRRLGRSKTAINWNSIYRHSTLLVLLIRVGAHSVPHSEWGLWSTYAEIRNWTPISTIWIWRSGIPCGWFATDYLTITGQSINKQSHS